MRGRRGGWVGWQLQVAPTEPLLDRGVLVRDKLSPVSLYLSLSFAAAVGVQIVGGRGGRLVSHVFMYLPTLGFRFRCLCPSQLDVPPSPPPSLPIPFFLIIPVSQINLPLCVPMRCRSISMLTRYSLISLTSLCPLSPLCCCPCAPCVLE